MKQSQQQCSLFAQQSLIQSLLNNKTMNEHWTNEKSKYEELKKNLNFYLDKAKHSILVPIGKKALMPGTLVHTNDILVSIGCDYFLKVSAKKATEICQRRLDNCNDKLNELAKEKYFLFNKKELPKKVDVYGGGDDGRLEIIEPYVEDKEKEWQEKHRNKVHEHKQKLAEVRQQLRENKDNKEQEDIWKQLDLLEMQEELEEEMDRLGISSSDEEEEEEEEESDDSDVSDQSEMSDNKESEPKKRVRFAQEDEVKTFENEVKSEKEQTVEKRQIKGLTAVSDTIQETVKTAASDNKSNRPVSKFKQSRLKQ